LLQWTVEPVARALPHAPGTAPTLALRAEKTQSIRVGFSSIGGGWLTAELWFSVSRFRPVRIPA